MKVNTSHLETREFRSKKFLFYMNYFTLVINLRDLTGIKDSLVSCYVL